MSKHIFILLLVSLFNGLIFGCSKMESSVEKNIDNQPETAWTSIFNGKDLSGWVPKFKGYPAGVNYNNTFRVVDGLLTVSYEDWDNFDNQSFGHLFTTKSYSDYRIRVEYRFIGDQIVNTPEFEWAYRNNGIMLHSPPAEYMGIDQAFPMSAEAQLLGGNGKEARTTANLCSPSTHIVKNGALIKKHCTKSSSSTYHGDQWVWFEAEMSAQGPVKHYINGELVFEYDGLQVDPEDEWSKQWLAEGNPLILTSGHISLQAETHPIQFRRIEIQPLANNE